MPVDSKVLSIVIPAHNEAATLPELLRRIRTTDIGEILKEIIVVDDASTDDTVRLLAAESGIRVLRHAQNRGKGGALKTGIAAATGDIVIFQDADLEYDPNDYAAMLAPLLNGTAPFTNGVRRAPENDPRRGTILGLLQRIGNRAITLLTNLLYGHHAREYEGCYKAFPRTLLASVSVSTDDFDFDNELVCRLLRRGIIPTDVDISYTPRGYAHGKHINWRHGLKILGTIIRVRMSRKNNL